jgi:5S rRNA maturation endonuclease (ribonuclease M5)
MPSPTSCLYEQFTCMSFKMSLSSSNGSKEAINTFGSSPKESNRMNITAEQIINVLEGTENLGTYWTALCPMHEDTKNSLSITANGDKPLVRCHAGCDQAEVFRACLALVNGEEAPEGLGRVKVQKAAKPFDPTTHHIEASKHMLKVNPNGRGYLASRGVSPEVASLLNWGMVTLKVEGKYKDCISTPHYHGDVLVGVKFRTIDVKEFTQVSGSKTDGLYGAQLLREGEEVLVLEGPEDVALAISEGFNAVGIIAASSGVSDADIATLTKYQKIYLIGDNDAAGKKAMDKLAARLPKAQTLRVTLGEFKDVGDVWKHDPLNFDVNLRGFMAAPSPKAVEFVDEYDLGTRFFIIGDGGADVWSETVMKDGEIILSHQSQSAFKARYNHKKVAVTIKTGDGEKKKLFSIAELWLMDRNRQQYTRFDFAPEVDLGPNVRNLWRGFAVKPEAGSCELYLAHVRDNICNGDLKLYAYVISWMAYKVQHPGERGHTALVLRGREGVGKNVFAEAFAYLFGGHSLQVTKQEQLTGRFNGHLQYQCVVIANESFFAGSKADASSLKGIITDEKCTYERKGVDPITGHNRISLIALSNEDWIVPAGPDARRFTVLDVGEDRREDEDYFGAIMKQLKSGGYEALLHFLLGFDIKGFNPRHHFATEALTDQKNQTLQGADAIWFECLQRGTLPSKVDGFLKTEDLLDWAYQQPYADWKRVKSQQVGLLLGDNRRGKKQGMGFVKDQSNQDGQRCRFWAIPPLAEARAAWDANRYPVEWPDVGEWQLDIPRN